MSNTRRLNDGSLGLQDFAHDYNYRHRLDESFTLKNELAGRSLYDYLELCDQEEFDLHLAVDTHVYFYAQPVFWMQQYYRNNSYTCHPVLIHADPSGDQGKVKQILKIQGDTMPPTFFQEVAILLGKFRFHDIAEALASTPVNANGAHKWEMLTNNCATLVLGMMRHLGTGLTPTERLLLASRLAAADKQTGGRLAGYVRENDKMETLLGLSGAATNEELLQRVVLLQIASALDSNSSVSSQENTEAPLDQQAGSDHVDVDEMELEIQALPLARRLEEKTCAAHRFLQDDSRALIVGGEPTNGQEFPFFVQAEDVAAMEGYPDLPLCGAVLVAPDVVLTTKLDCVFNYLYGTRVLVGPYNLNSTEGPAQWRNIVSDIMIHPQNNNNFKFNFALMKIEAVTLPNLIPVKLNSDKSNPTKGQTLTAIGFGRTKATGNYTPSSVLRKVSVKVYTTKQCKKFLTNVHEPSEFCAYASKKGPCLGDHGGPLIDSDGTLVGLMSYIVPKCVNDVGTPNAYARVSGAIDWIHETICKLSDYSSNYTFCPSFICPPDLTLLGYPTAELPSASANLTKPPQSSITQVPAAGEFLKAGTKTVVTITAYNNETADSAASCNWTVSVPPLSRYYYIPFELKKGKTAAATAYSLAVPYKGLFAQIWVDFSFSVARTKKTNVTVAFKRTPLPVNASTQTFLQSMTVLGYRAECVKFNITNPVELPDASDIVYAVYLNASGISYGGALYYYVYGQAKKY